MTYTSLQVALASLVDLDPREVPSFSESADWIGELADWAIERSLAVAAVPIVDGAMPLLFNCRVVLVGEDLAGRVIAAVAETEVGAGNVVLRESAGLTEIRFCILLTEFSTSRPAQLAGRGLSAHGLITD